MQGGSVGGLAGTGGDGDPHPALTSPLKGEFHLDYRSAGAEVDGGDAAGQVEMLHVLESHLDHHRLEILTGGKLQNGIREITVGAQSGKGAADDREHSQEVEVVQGPEQRRGRGRKLQDQAKPGGSGLNFEQNVNNSELTLQALHHSTGNCKADEAGVQLPFLFRFSNF